MRQLFAFLYRFRVFGFFLVIEFICIWLLISYNNYYNTTFFNSSNRLAGNVQRLSSNTRNYAQLREINADLASENAQLRMALYQLNSRNTAIDTSLASLYEIEPARVINNNFLRSENFMTLDKGSAHGIQPGMGVLSSSGTAGVVRSTSKNYSTVISMLHQGLMVSGQTKKTKTLCTTQWSAEGPLISDLKYIPRHVPIAIGDTIVTSGFNSVFPEDVMIGTIESFELPKESPFYEARIRLATDFSSIQSVYVVKHIRKQEIDSLEVAYE